MGTEQVLWDRARAAFSERIGLHFPTARTGDLKRALLPAATELGLGGAEECAMAFLEGRLDAAALEIVASHLTVGETYFMRGDETMAALRTEVLPGLIAAARRSGRRSLRLWSAGCCTGEEAYSIAILVSELLPDRACWDVGILATDVNPRFLAKAAAATYGEWSFRGTRAGFRARYFRRTAEGRHALDPGIRGMVRFAAHNLVDADAWPGLADPASFDLILCRNVLMYFTPLQAARVTAAFHRTLRDDGWLVVAPCEISQPLFRRFEPVRFDCATFHRKAGTGGARPPSLRLPADALPATQAPASGDAAANDGRPSAATAPSPPLAVPPVTPDRGAGPDPAMLERRARALADRGRPDEALAWCERWIAADKLDGAAHYLRAAILIEDGRWEQARESLQRCLYLDPEDAMAGFALGNLERSLGRQEAARRQYRNTLAVLGRCDTHARLAHAEGITAGQLGKVVGDLLQEGRA